MCELNDMIYIKKAYTTPIQKLKTKNNKDWTNSH